jgi:hypothetical protein
MAVISRGISACLTATLLLCNISGTLAGSPAPTRDHAVKSGDGRYVFVMLAPANSSCRI